MLSANDFNRVNGYNRENADNMANVANMNSGDPLNLAKSNAINNAASVSGASLEDSVNVNFYRGIFLLSITGKDGNSIEPKSPVEISLRLNDVAGGRDLTDTAKTLRLVRVYREENDKGGQVIKGEEVEADSQARAKIEIGEEGIPENTDNEEGTPDNTYSMVRPGTADNMEGLGATENNENSGNEEENSSNTGNTEENSGNTGDTGNTYKKEKPVCDIRFTTERMGIYAVDGTAEEQQKWSSGLFDYTVVDLNEIPLKSDSPNRTIYTVTNSVVTEEGLSLIEAYSMTRKNDTTGFSFKSAPVAKADTDNLSSIGPGTISGHDDAIASTTGSTYQPAPGANSDDMDTDMAADTADTAPKTQLININIRASLPFAADENLAAYRVTEGRLDGVLKEDIKPVKDENITICLDEDAEGFAIVQDSGYRQMELEAPLITSVLNTNSNSGSESNQYPESNQSEGTGAGTGMGTGSQTEGSGTGVALKGIMPKGASVVVTDVSDSEAARQALEASMAKANAANAVGNTEFNSTEYNVPDNNAFINNAFINSLIANNESAYYSGSAKNTADASLDDSGFSYKMYSYNVAEEADTPLGRMNAVLAEKNSITDNADNYKQAGRVNSEDNITDNDIANAAKENGVENDAAKNDAAKTISARSGSGSSVPSVLAAYDITIQNGETEYQPTKARPISVSITNPGINEGKANNLEIWHRKNDGTLEQIPDFTITGNTITFYATSFSVYVVIEHEEDTDIINPRVEFHFLNREALEIDGNPGVYKSSGYSFRNKAGNMQTTQILKNGSSLELFEDPTNYDGKYFYGWYVVTPQVISGMTDEYGIADDGMLFYSWPVLPKRVTFERAITISGTGNSVTWNINGVSGSGIADKDGNVHVFLAPVYQDYHFVNFMQYARDDANNVGAEAAKNVMTRKMLAFGSGTTVDVKISDIYSTSLDPVHRIFKGWEYNANAGTGNPPEWIQITTMDYTGAEIKQSGRDGVYLQVSGDLDLYPIFVEARWVDFNVGFSGNGADYVSSCFLLAWGQSNPVDMAETDGETVFETLEVPTRKGYRFGGWYVGAQINTQTGDFNENAEGTVCVTETVTDTDGKVSVKLDENGRACVRSSNFEKLWQIDGKDAYGVSGGKIKFYEGMERLTLYAKWIPDKTNITIVYWTENALDDDYFTSAVEMISTSDLGENFVANSEVKLNNLAAYTGVDRLDDVGAVPAGEEKFYELNVEKSDASQVISGNGTTLFNVYYNRIQFTLVFHLGRDGYVSTSGRQSGENDNWLQCFYGDNIAKALSPDPAPGQRGNSLAGSTFKMTYDGVTYDTTYVTDADNIKSNYIPNSNEPNDGKLYTITAKYGAYIGDQWPNQGNPNFEFLPKIEKGRQFYTWSAYYDSLYCKNANERTSSGTDINTKNPDINGVYPYMSAELCTRRNGTEVMPNHVHHLVAYFGQDNQNENGAIYFRKTYHVLYESIEGKAVDGKPFVNINEYFAYLPTTKSISEGVGSSVLSGRSFFEDSEYPVISNLPAAAQVPWEIEGYELLYSCYNQNDLYFFYTPKRYTLTFSYDGTPKMDTYYYGQSLKDAKKYEDPSKVGYGFLGWYTNTAGAGDPFDFANETMPENSLVLYPVFRVLQYTIKIDPNGGVIDSINYDYAANQSILLPGTGYDASQLTYYDTDFGTTISGYTLERNYIQLSEEEKATSSTIHYNGEKYYYVNMQVSDYDGDNGLPPELRNAVYLTSDQLPIYYQYYCNVLAAHQNDYPQNVHPLKYEKENGREDGLSYFIDKYTSYPNEPYRLIDSGDKYEFMGWYQVYKDGTVATMPFNFNTPINDELKLRAQWRLKGGIYIEYDPYYIAKTGDETMVVVGSVDQWTDPENINNILYSDNTPTQILHAPTNVTQDWIFRGWRVVRDLGKTETIDGKEYKVWEPVEFDENANVIYYNPGDDFSINSSLVTERNSFGNVIHMQAYYEEKDSSYRRPDVVTQLILDANNEYGRGYVRKDLGELPVLSGQYNDGTGAWVNTETGLVSDNISGNNPTQIMFKSIQSNLAVHLYKYATTDKHGDIQGKQFFNSMAGYFLLGFDERHDPNETSGVYTPYVPAFAADGIASVTKNSTRTLYAMWEPMVYVTFVNTTGADITVNLSGSGASTVRIVNKVTGKYDREKVAATVTIPAKEGDIDGEVKVVLPGAVPGTDSITAKAVNLHANFKLNVVGKFNEVQYGEVSPNSNGFRYGEESTYTGLLKTDRTGIIVTYTEETDDSVIFDVNGGNWRENSTKFKRSAFNQDLYVIYKNDIDSSVSYEPEYPDKNNMVFLGWTDNEDIAEHTDFSGTETVTWGETTITPNSGSTLLSKVRSNYIWNFSNPAPYGKTLYAVWSDLVTVAFDISRNNTTNHTWNGPETTSVEKPEVFYRSDEGSNLIKYTLVKGDYVPRPSDPTNNNHSDWVFMYWVKNDPQYRDKSNGPVAPAQISFDFSEPVFNDVILYTSWYTDIQRFDFTVRNDVVGGSASEEFEYTIAFDNVAVDRNNNIHIPEEILATTESPIIFSLKNTETYGVSILTTTYNSSNWMHYDVQVEISDRNGFIIESGHLYRYKDNSNKWFTETSQYKYTLKITQEEKNGTTTTVGVESTDFDISNSDSGITVSDEVRSFSFLSSYGNKFEQNINGYEKGISKSATIVFTNTYAGAEITVKKMLEDNDMFSGNIFSFTAAIFDGDNNPIQNQQLIKDDSEKKTNDKGLVSFTVNKASDNGTVLSVPFGVKLVVTEDSSGQSLKYNTSIELNDSASAMDNIAASGSSRDNDAIVTITNVANGNTGNVITFKNKLAGTRKVILRKVGTKGKNTYTSLSGAEFDVYIKSGGEYVKMNDISGLTSGTSGVFFIGKLPYGTYYLAETAPPDGYVKPEEFFVITVDENGFYNGNETMITNKIEKSDIDIPVITTTPTPTPTP